MQGSKASCAELLTDIKQAISQVSKAKIVVLPPFSYLDSVQQALAGTAIAWGAQDVNANPPGAHTGEISADMLTDFGCQYVLVGHSERRTHYYDDDRMVAMKFASAKAAGLIPILCVGESDDQREDGLTNTVIAEQLDEVMTINGGVNVFKDAVIAYEPLWAIGTGNTATPEQAQEVHAAIRNKIAALDPDLATTLPILHGGSVKANNAKDLFAMSDIDGGFIGGASLDAKQFIEIAQCIN